MAKKIIPSLNAVNGKSGYGDVTKCRTAFSALTIGALVAFNFAQVSKAGLFRKGQRKFDASLLRSVLGATMVKYWTSKGRLDDSGLTVDGLNELDRRLSDVKYGYRTTRTAVDTMIDGLKTGSDVTIDGHTFNMGKQAKVVQASADQGGLFDD